MGEEQQNANDFRLIKPGKKAFQSVPIVATARFSAASSSRAEGAPHSAPAASSQQTVDFYTSLKTAPDALAALPQSMAKRVSNVVNKIQDLATMGICMRIVARSLTESEADAILDKVASGKAVVRFDREPGSSHWRCTMYQDPDIEHDVLVMELAAQYTLLLHTIPGSNGRVKRNVANVGTAASPILQTPLGGETKRQGDGGLLHKSYALQGQMLANGRRVGQIIMEVAASQSGRDVLAKALEWMSKPIAKVVVIVKVFVRGSDADGAMLEPHAEASVLHRLPPPQQNEANDLLMLQGPVAFGDESTITAPVNPENPNATPHQRLRIKAGVLVDGTEDAEFSDSNLDLDLFSLREQLYHQIGLDPSILNNLKSGVHRGQRGTTALTTFAAAYPNIVRGPVAGGPQQPAYFL